MKKLIILICSSLLFNICLLAQNGKRITVKSGTKTMDYFPPDVRYRYRSFIDGQVIFKNDNVTPYRLNYNFLLSEMEYIQAEDTLYIAKKKDISKIVIAADTFYFSKGYLEQIDGGPVKVFLDQCWMLKDVQKLNPYGIPVQGSVVDTYDSFTADANFFNLAHDENMIFQKVEDYFISVQKGVFIPFKKKDVLELYPQKANDIKGYIKTNKVDFESREDLIRFADYLENFNYIRLQIMSKMTNRQ